jgi:hypothetical protein
MLGLRSRRRLRLSQRISCTLGSMRKGSNDSLDVLTIFLQSLHLSEKLRTLGLPSCAQRLEFVAELLTAHPRSLSFSLRSRELSLLRSQSTLRLNSRHLILMARLLCELQVVAQRADCLPVHLQVAEKVLGAAEQKLEHLHVPTPYSLQQLSALSTHCANLASHLLKNRALQGLLLLQRAKEDAQLIVPSPLPQGARGF